MVRAVFLDRDGTINEEVDYICRPNQLKILEGSALAIRSLNQKNLKVVVITNQAGIAYGYYTEEDLTHIHQELIRQLNSYKAKVDAIYYCPHHPEGTLEQYRVRCTCRKPEPGLFLKAAQELGIDLKASYVVGDKMSDIQAGKRLGCFTILVETGFGKRELAKGAPAGLMPDVVVPDLHAALPYLLQEEGT